MYTAITEDTLSVIKAPPLYAPTISTANDNTTSVNNIGTDLFQFRARFIYDDKEKSVWSPISSISNLSRKYTAYGYGTPSLTSQNRIDIDVVIPDDTTLVGLEIAVRKGNIGYWYSIDVVDITAADRDSTYTYQFFNDKLAYSLPQSDVNRPYDYVPRKAGAQEVVGDNTLVYGDITEGYDNNIDLDVSFGYDATSRAPVSVDVDVRRYQPYRLATNDMLVIYTGSVNSGGSIEVTISGGGISRVYHFPHIYYWDTTANVADADYNNYFDTVVESLADDPLLESVEFAIYGFGLAKELIFNFHGWVDDASASVTVFRDVPIYKTLKDGAKQEFGIVYGDKRGRIAPILTNEDTQFYIPFPTETGETYFDNTYALDYTVSHKPPIWAHTWRIVYGGSNVKWFQQFALRTHGFNDRSIWREDGLVKIKINEGINSIRNVATNLATPNYVWQEGDMLRIIGTREMKLFN